MELGQTIVQSRVIRLIEYFIRLFSRAGMLNHLIRNRIIALGQTFRVPFDRQKALRQQLLLKNRCVMGQNDTSCALFGPVALRAHDTMYIDHFKNERGIDAILAVNDFLPIFALPPS